MIKLSNSTISIFRECPLCFWLQFRMGIKRPDTIFPSLPSGMDMVIKHYFDSFRGKALPPELKGLDGARLFDDVMLLNAWRSMMKGIIYEDKTLDATLKGVVDDMLVIDGKMVILDFKTRGFPLKEDTHRHYQGQLDIYTYLLEKNGFDAGHYGYLLFYYPDKIIDSGVVMFDTKPVKMDTNPMNAEAVFRSAVECLRSDEPPQPSAGCGHCMYAAARK